MDVDFLASQVSIKNGNGNISNGNSDSHSRWQQEASNGANNSFKDSQTTSSRALISLLFAFVVVVVVNINPATPIQISIAIS